MPPKVERLEVDAGQLQLLAGGVLGGLVLHHTVVLEHVHERGLASIVKAQEENLGVLVVKPGVKTGEQAAGKGPS